MSRSGRLEWAAATAATMLLWGLLGASGCNMITGADDMTLTLEDDDPVGGQGLDTGSSSGDGGSASSTSSGGGAGAGDTTTTTDDTTTSGGGGSGAGDTTGGGGNTTTTTSTTEPPQPCEYPPGPYGVATGQTVPPNLSWQGFAPGSNTPTTVTIQDFFDCDGTRGIDAVVFDTSQFG